MKKPEDFLKELKDSKEFKEAKTDVATFLSQHASGEVKSNAVKCVIGDRTFYAVSNREKLANECENAYGWKASIAELNHYVSILKWFPENGKNMIPRVGYHGC
jgi:hypothetical protein